MKNLSPPLMTFLVLALGVVLFILTFNMVRSDSSASTATNDPAPAGAGTAVEEEDEEEPGDTSAGTSGAGDTDSNKTWGNPPTRGFTTISHYKAGDLPTDFQPAPGERPVAAGQNPFARHGARDHFTSVQDATNHVAAEIFEAVEDRPTLVVWLFDRTASASDSREKAIQQFESIYKKFEGLKTAGHPSLADSKTPRLLSVVGCFGKSVELLTLEPTDSESTLSQAVSSIRDDGSDEEHPFEAIDVALKQYEKLCRSEKRGMMLVVVSDEAGDDEAMVDQLVPQLRKAAIPVYVVGVAAPLGLNSSLSGSVKTESMKPVRQGPESMESEAIDMGGWMGPENPLDSGFGPFALSRLALETGGRYMAVRQFSSYDPKQMAQLAPDYVSRAAYDQLLSSNAARRALVEAAKLPHIDLTHSFDLLFFKQKDEAAMKRQLDKAQQASARLEPKVAPFYKALAAGESDRNKLTGARWQVGYDLAMGRAAAMRSRIEGYNASLAQLKAGKSFPDPNHNTWVLRATNDVKGDSGLEKLAGQARKYLTRVITEHPGTPWAMVANRELAAPLGWEWVSR
jgi:hypothetical protein